MDVILVLQKIQMKVIREHFKKQIHIFIFFFCHSRNDYVLMADLDRITILYSTFLKLQLITLYFK